MVVKVPGLAIGVDEHGRLPLPWLGEGLRAGLDLQRSHAVLAHGPAGAGHLEFGLLLAMAWLCEGEVGRPCGRCGACRLVRQRAHPDLLIVVPDAWRIRLGWVSDDEAALTKADAKPSRDIRVEQVRRAIAWSQQTSGRGRGKAMVIHPGDALNGPAANALLKTLEEPPGQLRILITSTDPERLLPTVRSRCQRLRLVLPDRAQVDAWLRTQGLDDPAPLLRVAGGSPLEALALAEEGIDAALLSELPRRVARGDASTLLGRPIPRVVELLLKLSHDLSVVAAGGSPRFFGAADLGTGADAQALQRWQQALLAAARHDEHPWNAGLLVESLVTQAASLWPSSPTGRAERGRTPLNSAR
jgi:DNA polymerase III subunit delta'